MHNELTSYPENDYTTRSQVRVLQLLMGGSIDKRRCAEAIVAVTGKAYKYLSVRQAVAAALYAAHGGYRNTDWETLASLYKEKLPKFNGVKWETSLGRSLNGVDASDTLYSRYSLGDILKRLNIEQRESLKALVKSCWASNGRRLSTKAALTTVEHILWFEVSGIMKDKVNAVSAFEQYTAQLNNAKVIRAIESVAFEYFGWDPLSPPLQDVIRSTYRTIARKLHPDRGGSLKAFQEYVHFKGALEERLFPTDKKVDKEVV